MNLDWLLSLALWIYGAAIVALSVRILMRRRAVGGTLAWLLFVYILPGLGIVFYLLFGERYLGRLRAKRALDQFRYYSLWLQRILITQESSSDILPKLKPVMSLTKHSMDMPILSSHSWSVFDKAERVFSSLEQDINQATSTIFIEFYIVEAEGKVEAVLQALECAVSRGVHVYLMMDSVGSNRFLRSERCKNLTKAGVKTLDVLHANYLRMTLRRQDLRQHRKLIAIDNKVAYTGSMNLADPEHFKTGSGVGPWVDIMVRLEGSIAPLIQSTIIFDWEMETGIRLEKYLTWPTQPDSKSEWPNRMQLLPSGPAMDEELLLQALLTAIHTAEYSVIITTPYFVPDEALMQALKTASKRGVAVTIFLPRRNDSRLAQYAGRSFYDELLLAGVCIQRYNGGLLHSKTVIVDDDLVLIGSVNLDMRSIWLNFEVTLVVDDPLFCTSVKEIVECYKADSERLTLSDWRRRPVHKRVLENIAQLASPLL